MRPIQLTLQAFGPYAGREVIDFRPALAAGLFGIYGPTGSGKSSIFSAISFVLFGETAKGDQDPSSLRSDHASLELLTEVEFFFEVGSKTYLIRRRPTQERPSQRGEGTTVEQHSAWLFDVTGVPVDEVGSQNPGKVLAEKKVGLVAEEVKRILGYGADQFRQIVLLPQGQFEKFLDAKTEERLVILRDLFDVSLFRSLTDVFKTQERELAQEIRQSRALYSSILQNEGLESDDALKAKIEETSKKVSKSQGQAEEAQKVVEAHDKVLNDARNTVSKFDDLKAAEAALKDLGVRSAEIAQAKVDLAGARKAQSLLDVDTAYADAIDALQKATKNANTAEAALKHATSNASETSKRLLEAKLKAPELEKCKEEVRELNAHRKTLDASEAAAERVRCTEEDAKKARETLKTANSDLEKRKKERAEAVAALDGARKSASEFQSLNVKKSKVEQDFAAARRYEKLERDISASLEEVENAKAKSDDARQQEALRRQELEQAEHALAGMQAVHLAEKLVDGAPCPVCGSCEHPVPAEGDAESAGLDAAFREAREKHQAAQASTIEAIGLLKSQEAILAERTANLASLPKPDSSSREIAEKKDEISTDIKKLGAPLDIAALEISLSNLEAAVASAQKVQEASRESLSNAENKLATAIGAFESAVRSVPEPLRVPRALAQALGEAEEKIQLLQGELEDAQNADVQARESLIKGQAELNAAKEAQSSANERVERSKQKFDERLKKAELDEQSYQSFKAKIANIDQLAGVVEAYDADLSRVKQWHAKALEGVEGLVRPDITALEGALSEARAQLSQLQNLAATEGAQLKHLKTVAKDLATREVAIAEAEKRYAPLASVAVALRGENPARTKLETFAITAMFEHVLDAANLRLGPMTSGRYELQREETATRAGYAGLGITVHDVHTGKPRATSSLSGGEKFLAALSLALGLSDVVERTSGGIRLDTIFIDEGFGSLDMETLDQALQTLQDLIGQSRAVGLISHVELVQQAIPHGFQIKKTIAGSHVEVGRAA